MNKILIKNTAIITMEDEKSIINKGYILIENRNIKKVAQGAFEGNTDGFKIIDAAGCVVMPGLINCHTHIPMTLLRGYGEGLPLMKWLNEKIWPFEAKLTSNDIYIGAKLGMLEMIKSGTTTFVDMYYNEDAIGKAAEECGVRAFLGSPVIGDNWQMQVEESVRLYEHFKDSELVSGLMAPHSPYTCSRESLRECGEKARIYNMPIHIHIAETEDEIKIVKDRYGISPFKLCEETGIFENLNVLAAHCVHTDAEDISIMEKYKINAVHNPQSNMKLASGVCPVNKFLNANINVALGTDGASSNNNLNMIEEMQTASMLQKLSTKDATTLGAYETLKLATVNGAKALGMGESLGKIKEGYKADIILIDFNKPYLLPIYDIYSNIVFSAQGSDVKTVIVNGNIIMDNHKVKVMDENIVMKSVQECVEKILQR